MNSFGFIEAAQTVGNKVVTTSPYCRKVGAHILNVKERTVFRTKRYLTPGNHYAGNEAGQYLDPNDIAKACEELDLTPHNLVLTFHMSSLHNFDSDLEALLADRDDGKLEFPETEVQNLIAHIVETGVVYPLIGKAGKKNTLLAGKKRLLAFHDLGIASVPVFWAKEREGNKLYAASAEAQQPKEVVDEIDTITLDVPLFLRLMEACLEKEVQDDIELHEVVSRVIALSKQKEVLDIRDYRSIIQG